MKKRWLVTGAVAALMGAGAVVAASENGGRSSRPGPDLVGAPGPTKPALERSSPPMLSGGPAAQSTPAQSTPAQSTPTQSDTAQVNTAPSDPAQASPPPPVPGPGVRIDKKVVKTADVTVEVGKGRFQDAFEQASKVAAIHGGFVASSSTNSREDESAMGSLELRVPAASFEAARQALSKLGKVSNERISGRDVGGQLVDIDARLRSLSAEEDALRALMTRARTVGETVEVQRQLTTVREQIEQLMGQKARLDDAVAMATIRASVSEPGAAREEDRSQDPSLVRSFSRAVEGTLAVLGGTLVVVGYVLPLAVLTLLGWLGYRLVVRRSRPAVSG